jgi:Methylase of polypeptide chain release factors
MEDRLKLVHASFSQFVEQNVTKFDFIISNPPYVPTAKYEKLEKQIK